MEVLKHKSYKSYEKLSRYSSFPYYYHELDDKYVYGITSYLKDDTTYKAHIVQKGDNLDTLALHYYNNPTLYWIIASFNRITDCFAPLKIGTTIKIPTLSNIEFKD